jgi:hypothetical protein
MAYVTRVDGPNYKGVYQFCLRDGTTITAGPTAPTNTRYHDFSNPDRYWFVSIGPSKDHTSCIS